MTPEEEEFERQFQNLSVVISVMPTSSLIAFRAKVAATNDREEAQRMALELIDGQLALREIRPSLD